MSQQQTVTQVKEANKQQLMTRPNVVGAGVGYKISEGQQTDQLSVVVLVRQKLPRAALTTTHLVPQTMDGVATDVIEVGDLRALQTPTSRFRPCPAGVSIGHFRITAGTFGCVVRDKATGTRLILSNNHVLANSNNAVVGDTILQPGPTDGGREPNDVIAHLERFVPIDFGESPGECPIAEAVAQIINLIARLIGSTHQVRPIVLRPSAVNLVDAALARPVDDTQILDEIRDIGVVTQVKAPTLGMNVRKSGRTTGFTTGRITVMDTSVTVGYGPGKSATFENQVVTTPMSAPGDSGSLIVDANSLSAVGLLYAGSDQATIFSPIQAVFDSLNVGF